MTLGSASSVGRVRDALSGRPKVAIVTGASSGIGLDRVLKFCPLTGNPTDCSSVL